MKRIIVTFICLTLCISCATVPPIRNQQYTQSNLPKSYKIEVPYVRQGYNQCFPACLTMIFMFYGKTISLREVDNHIRGAKGTTIESAEQFCRQHKFNVYRFYDRSGNKMRYFLSQGYPLMARIQTGAFGSRTHVIVVNGYDDVKQMFYINDPGTYQFEISYKSFKEKRRIDSPMDQHEYYTLLIWPK